MFTNNNFKRKGLGKFSKIYHMLPDNHFFVTAAKDIDEICQPLFRHSNIALFKFIRVFLDGSYIIFSSNGEFVKKLSAVIWSSSDLDIIKNRFEPNKRYYLLSKYKKTPNCMMPIAEEFNTNNGLLIKETNISHQDNFHFIAQSKNMDLYDYLFNNIEFVERFIFYFKDKASHHIKRATTGQRLYAIKPELYPLEYMLSMPSTKSFTENLKVRKYIFTSSEKFISLSSQEMNSVKQLAKGYKIKEAARHLNISPGTVDYYLGSARNKLKINNNRQLISTFWENLSLA